MSDTVLPRETVVAALRRAIQTASNDDLSLPDTQGRERHCQRLTAMLNAVAFLESDDGEEETQP
jgi:hypothetical protein